MKIDLESRTEIGLFLVKPDALAKQEDGYAKRRIQEEGLRIIGEQEILFTPEITWDFYHDKHDEKYPALLEYITSGKSLALIVDGRDCYKKLGALKREMRGSFSHGDIETGTHSSDDYENAIREMRVLGLF